MNNHFDSPPSGGNEGKGRVKARGRVLRLLAIAMLAAVSMACVAQERRAADDASPAIGGAESTDLRPAAGPGLGPSPEGVLHPVAQPLMPKTIPGYTELDPETGLHMTGTPVLVDLATYRLKVTGEVDRETELTFDDLRRLPRAVSDAPLVCEGFFVDRATWAGASLAAVLDRAGIRDGATWLELVSADGYATRIAVDNALAADALLAYEVDGKPIPVIHGFPVRAVFPSVSGNEWAKWLVEISVE